RDSSSGMLRHLVAVQGFEPRTPRIWAACSNHLSYTALRREGGSYGVFRALSRRGEPGQGRASYSLARGKRVRRRAPSARVGRQLFRASERDGMQWLAPDEEVVARLAHHGV